VQRGADIAAPPMCVTGKQIGYTSSGVGRMRVTNAYMLAITDVSECHAPFGSDVEPEVWYSHRRTFSGSGAGGSTEGSPLGSVSLASTMQPISAAISSASAPYAKPRHSGRTRKYSVFASFVM